MGGFGGYEGWRERQDQEFGISKVESVEEHDYIIK